MALADLALDRMTIEDAGRDPAALAEAIHAQLGPLPGCVDVHKIALALDIVEIVSKPLASIEGALVTQPERTDGVILTNARSSYRRQRFTVAHELLHFLNDRHVQTDDGFRCRLDDFRNTFGPIARGVTRHARQEREANRFAIELMAPRRRVERLFSDEPDLRDVLAIARDLDLSKEAAARRYVELHPAAIAIALSDCGRLRYAAKGREFPALAIRRGQQLPSLPDVNLGSRLSTMEEADPRDWFNGSVNVELTIQHLEQDEGCAMTLIVVAEPDEKASEIDDVCDRFTRFS